MVQQRCPYPKERGRKHQGEPGHRENHTHLKRVETRINGAKYFLHLDVNDGCMHLELAKESRKLAKFYMHRGLKRSKRLHFGVNSAAEIFNEEVRNAVAQEPNAVSIYDDILVFGATPEGHDEILRHVLQLWCKQGRTLSLKKKRLNHRAFGLLPR